MSLPVEAPVKPMLAKLVRELPRGTFLYEPKWDGFRCVLFRDCDRIELMSRNERPFNRYFPELVEQLPELVPERCVLDGEIVIATPDGLDFDALLLRIHPAGSRVSLLAERTPASFIAFDLLALDDRDLRALPMEDRRRELERIAFGAPPPLYLTPATRDRDVAERWFQAFEGAGFDGVMAKSLDLPYLEGERAMIKVKHERTADCAVGGYRVHKDGAGVGSLLLGLYDRAGRLHHVGVASGFPARERKKLLEELRPLAIDAGEDHPWLQYGEEVRTPGAQSRWSAGRDLGFTPIRIERVAEVRYDHLQGDRFRHATHFLRWRPDRDPESCTYDQLEAVAPAELFEVFTHV